jgi:hypothetical protein
MSQHKSIIELADIIASNTTKYNEYLVSNGLPPPTHTPSEKETPLDVPENIASLREQTIEASHELHELLIGPVGVSLTAYARVRPKLLHPFLGVEFDTS